MFKFDEKGPAKTGGSERDSFSQIELECGFDSRLGLLHDGIFSRFFPTIRRISVSPMANSWSQLPKYPLVTNNSNNARNVHRLHYSKQFNVIFLTL